MKIWEIINFRFFKISKNLKIGFDHRQIFAKALSACKDRYRQSLAIRKWDPAGEKDLAVDGERFCGWQESGGLEGQKTKCRMG